MKKVKVKEIKGKVKVIRELNEKTEGDKEIKELTKNEVPVHSSQQSSGFSVGSFSSLASGGDSPRVASRTVEDDFKPVRQVQPERNNTPLYDVGKSMGGQIDERKYKTVESIGSANNIRTVGVGRDFAMGGSASPYPEANRVESSLRQESNEKKYASDIESGGGKKGKRYAWEV